MSGKKKFLIKQFWDLEFQVIRISLLLGALTLGVFPALSSLIFWIFGLERNFNLDLYFWVGVYVILGVLILGTLINLVSWARFWFLGGSANEGWAFFYIMFNGTNINLKGEGDPIIGFYNSRKVWAKSPDQAVMKAKESIFKEWEKGFYLDLNKGKFPDLIP